MFRRVTLNPKIKNLQRQRVIDFFKEATKLIIEEEGVLGASARKIGERAGYSYATLYNYFQDTKELITLCAIDELKRLVGILDHLDQQVHPGIEAIIQVSESYLEYFYTRPKWFEVIFMYDLGEYPIQYEHLIGNPNLGDILIRQIRHVVLESPLLLNKDIAFYQRAITDSLHGKLLIMMRKRQDVQKPHIMNQLRKEIYQLFAYEKESK